MTLEELRTSGGGGDQGEGGGGVIAGGDSDSDRAEAYVPSENSDDEGSVEVSNCNTRSSKITTIESTDSHEDRESGFDPKTQATDVTTKWDLQNLVCRHKGGTLCRSVSTRVRCALMLYNNNTKQRQQVRMFTFMCVCMC
jgi:hypothetical protein